MMPLKPRRVDKVQVPRSGQLLEQRLTAAQHQRRHEQAVLIDEVIACECARKRRAAPHGDIRTGLAQMSAISVARPPRETRVPPSRRGRQPSENG